MNIDVRGDMWTSYLSVPVEGFVCKLFSFSLSPVNKTATSDFNWIEFKLYHQSKSKIVTKEYYLNATSNTIFFIDKTGVVTDDITVFVGKDTIDDNNYNVYMLPTLSDSITYLQVTHCNIPSFFTFNNNATFDIKASTLVDKLYATRNYQTDQFTLENGWVNYSSESKTT